MRKTKLFSLALLAVAWLTGSSAFAQHDGEHSYDNGICTIEGCTDKYQPAELNADGWYLLSNAGQVEWFGQQVTAGYHTIKGKLTDDIDYRNKENAHKPIGGEDHKYIGQFDGQGHRIKNMIINNPTLAKTKDAVGFFGSLRGGGDGYKIGSTSEKDVNLEVVIKNLIIDKSCKITSQVAMTGGVVGRVNNQTTGHHVTIENCINEAEVTSTQKNVAGILGTVDGTNLNLTIKNCANLGRIDGATAVSAKENAAICGWTGKYNNTNVQLTGCWNIGEVVTIDGNGYNLFRVAGSSVIMQNNFDLNPHANGKQGLTKWETEKPAMSGELCYVLNSNQSSVAWFQQLDENPADDYPMPIYKDNAQVYKVADFYCDGTPKGSIVYRNQDGGSHDEHVKGENFVCVNCNNYVFDGIENYMQPDGDGWYHLKTVADVEWFSAMVNKKFHGAMNAKLDNDIDFGGVPNAHKPIGTSGHKFGGKFDGQGYRIKGMVITKDIIMENRAYDGVGFFGSVRGGIADQGGWDASNKDVVIKNLIIDSSCSIEYDNRWAAGILGHINSMETDGTITVRNCGNEANVTATDNANAGIVGIVDATALKLDIIGCWNTGDITGTGANMAGILGGNSSSKATVTIKNCWNEGNIAGNKENGAISGWVGSNAGNSVTGCYNLGQVTGLDGQKSLYRGTVDTAKNNCDILTQAQEGTAQIITKNMVPTGELCYLLNGDQSDIQWTQTLDGTQPKPLPDTEGSHVYCHGQIYCSGESAPGTIYNNEGPDGVVNLPHVPAGNGFCSVCNNNLVESLTQDEEGFYLISNAGELEKFSDMVEVGGQSADNKAKLTADIDMAGVTHKPIGGGANDSNKFNSTFDGQNHTISNMTSFTRTENVGLFSWVRGSSIIKNLTIDETCEITGTDHVAAFVGKIQAGDAVRFENCINRATVICSNNHAAAFVGKSFTGNLKTNMINCGNAGRIESGLNACALVSWNTGGTIKNCWNVGEIVKSDWDRANGADYDNTIMVSTLNLFNGNAANNVTLVNTFDASPSAERSQGTLLDAAAATSGELAYKIGGDWKQFIKKDEHPVFDGPAVSYVGDAGYATLFDTTTGYVLNGDVTANVATLNNETWLKLTEIENVPASTPVILKGTYYNKFAQDVPEINITNELQGTTVDTEADGTMYVLAKPEDKEVGFYQAIEGTTIPAGKAYYQATTNLSVKAFFFSGEDATAIDNVNANVNDNNAAIYNIAGQRINKLQKGINIVNGKKVLF